MWPTPRAPISSTRKRVAGVGAQDGQRQPELVVERPVGGDGRAEPREHLGQQVLGAGLPLRAGERDDPDRSQPAQRWRGQVRRAPTITSSTTTAGAPTGPAGQHRRGAAVDRGRRRSRGRRRARPGPRRTARPAPPPGCRRRPVPATSTPSASSWTVAADDLGDLRQGHRDHRAAQLLAQHVTVVEGVHGAVHLLALLVPLAGHHHARPRGPARETASRIAARRSPCSCTSARSLAGTSRAPASTAARIRRRVLGARVVVGHDHDVGQPGGDLAHERPLAGVAVAAGPEHDEEPAPGRPGGARRGPPRTASGLCA